MSRKHHGSKRRKIFAIDCETDPFKADRLPVPFLWDAYDGESHFTFEHVSDLKHFLEKQNCVAYAHNGGRFDFLMPGFCDGFENLDKIKLINGRLAQFAIGECEYRDSMLIYPESLSSFQKMEIDYTKLEKKVRKQHMVEIMKYLHCDTESLYKLVKYFIDTYGFKLTIAGAAMAFWEGSSHVTAPRSSRKFFDSCSPFYYGGRVQVFRGGILNEKFTALDINSAYPFAMLHDHPLSTEYHELASIPKCDPIIPQSLYRIRARSAGALPFRDGDSVTFPADNNTRTFDVTGWELLAGLETNTVDVSQILFRRDFRENVKFTKYIRHFYDLKKTAGIEHGKQSAEYLFAKRMMNALSGKFGAHPDEYRNFYLFEGDYEEHITKCKLCKGKRGGCPLCGDSGTNGKSLHGRIGKFAVVGEPLGEDELRYYNIATIASITGFVRAYLWRHLCALWMAGRHPIYCDTDCAVFTGGVQGLPETFKIGGELGEWSIDGEFANGGIGGKKMYAFRYINAKRGKDNYGNEKITEWKTACKGARLDAGDIVRVAGGKTVTYSPIAPTLRFGSPGRFIKRRISQTGVVAESDKRR